MQLEIVTIVEVDYSGGRSFFSVLTFNCWPEDELIEPLLLLLLVELAEDGTFDGGMLQVEPLPVTGVEVLLPLVELCTLDTEL